MTLRRQQISDEEFGAQLSGPIADEGITAVSAPDEAELRRLQSALRSYRGETLQWAERRSAGQPSLASLAQKQERWAALPRWSLALVALITIGGGVAHLASSRAAIEQTPAALNDALLVTDRPSTPADLAADNQLLSSIDEALSYHTASPVDSLNLRREQGGTAAGIVPGVTD